MSFDAWWCICLVRYDLSGAMQVSPFRDGRNGARQEWTTHRPSSHPTLSAWAILVQSLPWPDTMHPPHDSSEWSVSRHSTVDKLVSSEREREMKTSNAQPPCTAKSPAIASPVSICCDSAAA